MPKWRVTYTGVKHQLTSRVSPQGQVETLDDRVSFYETKTVNVEARDEKEAISLATKNLPSGCDVTAQASRGDLP